MVDVQTLRNLVCAFMRIQNKPPKELAHRGLCRTEPWGSTRINPTFTARERYMKFIGIHHSNDSLPRPTACSGGWRFFSVWSVLFAVGRGRRELHAPPTGKEQTSPMRELWGSVRAARP